MADSSIFPTVVIKHTLLRLLISWVPKTQCFSVAFSIEGDKTKINGFRPTKNSMRRNTGNLWTRPASTQANTASRKHV